MAYRQALGYLAYHHHSLPPLDQYTSIIMPKGYAVADPKNYTNFEVIDFKLKPEGDEDVTVAIQVRVCYVQRCVRQVTNILDRTCTQFGSAVASVEVICTPSPVVGAS